MNLFKPFAAVFCAALFCVTYAVADENKATKNAAKADENSIESNVVVMQTNQGDIVIELAADKAPQTVANFKQYVDSGFYDGTVFHRVIPGFMIQGGGFDTQLKQKPNEAPIQNEADNGLQNVVGSLAMARTSAPHSATSQFFINVNDNGNLDHRGKSSGGWGYAVFGQVSEGLDIVMKVSKQATKRQGRHANVPVEPVVIEKAYFR